MLDMGVVGGTGRVSDAISRVGFGLGLDFERAHEGGWMMEK